MTTGILLLAEGAPKDASRESVLEYARDINGCEQVFEHLGPVQRALYGNVVMSMIAKRWTSYFKENEGVATALPYQDILARLACSLEQLTGKAFSKKPHIAIGMLHGSPSIEDAVDLLADQGCRDFLIVSLFAFDLEPLTKPALLRAKSAIEHGIKAKRPPKIELAPWLCESATFKRLVLSSLEDDWHPRPNSRLLVLMPSYPKAAIQDDCALTSQIANFVKFLEEKSILSPSQIHTAYLGSIENSAWTGPFAEKMLLGWVGGSVRDVHAIIPAFTQNNAIVACEADKRLGDYFRANSTGLSVEYTLSGRLDEHDLAEAVFDVAQRGLRRL